MVSTINGIIFLTFLSAEIQLTRILKVSKFQKQNHYVKNFFQKRTKLTILSREDGQDSEIPSFLEEVLTS